MVTPLTALYGVGILVSLFFSAFFSASEAALLTVNRTRLRYLADQGHARARRALLLLSKPNRLLATIVIGNNLVNVVASVLVTALAIDLVGNYALGVAAGALTILLLLLGEVTPKAFASDHAEWTSIHVARPVSVFVFLFTPIEVVFSWVAKGLLTVVGATRLTRAKFHTEEEIKVLLRVGRERGHIEQHEAELIRAIFDFNDLEIQDIMRPAREVISVAPQDPLARVVELVARTGHSRFPVLDDGKPKGFVYVKDFILMSPDQLRALTVSHLIRALPVFPTDHRVGKLLRTLQADGNHMACVVDANERLIGLVTIEDVLEEIVGEITDEYEAARRRLVRDRARLEAQRSQLAATAGRVAAEVKESQTR